MVFIIKRSRRVLSWRRVRGRQPEDGCYRPFGFLPVKNSEEPPVCKKFKECRQKGLKSATLAFELYLS